MGCDPGMPSVELCQLRCVASYSGPWFPIRKGGGDRLSSEQFPWGSMRSCVNVLAGGLGRSEYGRPVSSEAVGIAVIPKGPLCFFSTRNVMKTPTQGHWVPLCEKLVPAGPGKVLRWDAR